MIGNDNIVRYMSVSLLKCIAIPLSLFVNIISCYERDKNSLIVKEKRDGFFN